MNDTFGGIDHAMVLVRDLGAAAVRMGAAGFLLTPYSRHTHLGTANRCMVFRNMTYVELLGIETETPQNAPFASAMATREGTHAVALKTNDAVAAAAHFREKGFRGPDAFDFSRGLETPEGTATASFSIAQIEPEHLPDGLMFACVHHTPDVIWHDAFLDHPNTATGIAEIVCVAGDVAAAAERYGRLLDPFVEPADAGAEEAAFQLGAATLRLMSAGRFAADRGGTPGGTGFRLLRFDCADLDAAARCLEKGRVPFESTGRLLRIAPADGCGDWIELSSGA